jgi:Protein of unknown function (DUF3568)
MPQTTFQHQTRSLFLLFVIALTLPSSGCIAAAVTAGVVGAGAAGYVYYTGAVPRDFPANMDQAWAGTQLALADLGMPVVSAVGDGDKVKITLEPRAARVPADGQWTHVTVRVALVGDNPVSERIMSQIDTRLAPPGTAGQQVLQAQPAAPLNQTVAPPIAPH